MSSGTMNTYGSKSRLKSSVLFERTRQSLVHIQSFVFSHMQVFLHSDPICPGLEKMGRGRENRDFF